MQRGRSKVEVRVDEIRGSRTGQEKLRNAEIWRISLDRHHCWTGYGVLGAVA